MSRRNRNDAIQQLCPLRIFSLTERQAAALENMGEVFAKRASRAAMLLLVCRMRGENPSSLHL
jgi:hypothetical protein